MPAHILIIEDDERLARMVADYLQAADCLCSLAPDGLAGLKRLTQGQDPGQRANEVDLVVLDLMMPHMDGLEVCRQIRALPGPQAKTPVLMLTAKGDAMDRIVGLEMGADDYLPKPFEPRELLARIKAILRRASLRRSDLSTQLRFGSLVMDVDARQIHLRGKPCDLTAYQYDLLMTMANRAGRVMTREQIMEAVRGRELESFDRSIDVHIGRIRQLIEDDPKTPKRILTVRGVGYVFAKQQD